MKVNIVNRSRFPLPQYATVHSAGLDLRADLESALVLKTTRTHHGSNRIVY